MDYPSWYDDSLTLTDSGTEDTVRYILLRDKLEPILGYRLLMIKIFPVWTLQSKLRTGGWLVMLFRERLMQCFFFQ